MKLIYINGPIEIWSIYGEFYVYGVMHSGDVVVCPSIDMAYEVAASR